MQQPGAAVTPDRILKVGFGFWASKALLSAVEVGVFTELARGPLDGDTLRKRLGLHPRGARDFLDALVALGMLTRSDGSYANSPETHLFLDRTKPTYVGGVLEMANQRLYGYWGSLTEGLRTGKPQNESKQGGGIIETIYQDQGLLRSFLQAMTGVSMGSAVAVAQKFPWDRYQTFVDVGCAAGALPVQLALAHPHLRGIGFDLPPVKRVFEEYVSSFGLFDRLAFVVGDFFTDRLPEADVVVMGHILHDWNLDEKLALLHNAYEVLPRGGALVVYEALIDDDRSQNAFGLLMSLNMLIETEGGFDYTGADVQRWMRDVGFRETSVEHLAGPESMAVGIK